MASASNERPRTDGETGPSLRDRAEAIAERLDRWSRAGGRRLPDPLLEKLERLIELSMRAAIYTFERRSSSRSERNAAAPKEAPAAPAPPSAAAPPSDSAPAAAAGAHAATDAGHTASAPPVRADARR